MVIIYSITSLKGIKCYIGSTVQTLNNRKAQHKKKQNCTSKLLFDEYGFDNCIFTILEECIIEQRFERERHYIENTPNIVNIKITKIIIFIVIIFFIIKVSIKAKIIKLF